MQCSSRHNRYILKRRELSNCDQPESMIEACLRINMRVASVPKETTGMLQDLANLWPGLTLTAFKWHRRLVTHAAHYGTDGQCRVLCAPMCNNIPRPEPVVCLVWKSGIKRLLENRRKNAFREVGRTLS